MKKKPLLLAVLIIAVNIIPSFASPAVPVMYDTFVMEYFMTQILEDKTGKPKNEILSWMLTNDIAEKAYTKIKSIDLKQYVFLKTLEWSVANNKNQVEAADLVTDGVYISDAATIKANVNQVLSDGMLSLSEVNAKTPFASFVLDEYVTDYPPIGAMSTIRKPDNTIYQRNFSNQYLIINSWSGVYNQKINFLIEVPRNNVKIYYDTNANPSRKIYAVKVGSVDSSIKFRRFAYKMWSDNAYEIDNSYYSRDLYWESYSGAPSTIIDIPGIISITDLTQTAFDKDRFMNAWDKPWTLVEHDMVIHSFNGSSITELTPDIPVDDPTMQLTSNVLTLSQALTTFNKGLTGQQDQITDLLNQQTQTETSTLGAIDTMNGTLEDIYEGVEGQTNILTKIWAWLQSLPELLKTKIIEALKYVFGIDFVKIYEASGLRAAFDNKFLALGQFIDIFDLQPLNNQHDGKFYVDLPAFMGGGRHCFLDITAAMDVLVWAKTFISAVLWIKFGQFVIKQLDVKLQVG